MTVKVWSSVVLDGREFDERLDAPRFRRAFLTLAVQPEWPKPAHFLAALPERDQLAIAKTMIPADPEKVRAVIAEIAGTLKP